MHMHVYNWLFFNGKPYFKNVLLTANRVMDLKVIQKQTTFGWSDPKVMDHFWSAH